VGYLDEISPFEASAVLYLRMWFDGPDAQTKVWQDFAGTLGPLRGRHALNSFEKLCSLCANHGRRPLLRHGVTCKCLGGDESCFANFICYASEGAPEDAFLLASNIVPPRMASELVVLARQFGTALKKMVATTDTMSLAQDIQPTHPEPSNLQ
ncbi:MAG: hypothetical protein AAGF56_01880, partial [Pseudomonadota bacterium]